MAKRGEWTSGREATRITGMSPYALMRLAAVGRIRCRAAAGESVRFRREDLERLANEESR